MKVLHLTLKKEPFEVMATGEKPDEFRKESTWIRSRLLTQNGGRKEYDVVKFTNGYGAKMPSFTAKYNGFSWATESTVKTYSNGLQVEVEKGDIIIHIGEILETSLNK